MTVTLNLKPQVDLPVWEWCRFAPEVTAATLTTCNDESAGGRYIYYQGTAKLYRYDTISDGWQHLASPPLAPATVGAMAYSGNSGYRGNILGASNTTVTIPGFPGTRLVGKTIRIVSGTGAGQVRTITAVADPVVADFGVASAATTLLITDNQTIPKKWTLNQWAGYQCRLSYGIGTGESQFRRILYNDNMSLTVSDANWQHYSPWNNTPFTANAPYFTPAAGVNYEISSQVVTVATWTTNPDTTSKFVITAGAIWHYTGRTVALGSAQMQWYDILSDTWQTKTCTGGMQNIITSLDAAIERTGEHGGTFVTGAVDNASAARTMVLSGGSWTPDRYANYQVRVTKTSTGVEQRRRIIGNTADTLYVSKPWDTTPDNTYTFAIYGDTNAIWQVGNTRGGLLKYLVEEDLWVEGHEYDNGIVANLKATKTGQDGISYSAVVNTAAMVAVVAAPTVAGTGYKVGDILNVTQGTGGKVRVVTTTATTGAVLTVELYACGTAGTYTNGTGKATTSAIPAAGGGSGCTVEITAGNSARVTTAIAHNFKTGDSITLSGATVAGWNAAFSIIGCDLATAFDIVPPNTTAPAATSANGVNLLVDPSKNWTAGEHVGKLVTKFLGGTTAPTTETRKITANDATTLTVGTWVLPVVGKDRYVIHEQKAFGADEQNRISTGHGWATVSGSSSTALGDTTKAWIPGQWIGYKMKVLCGTGYDKGEVAISDNTATILTLTTPGFTPDATTKYEIMDSWGIATGSFAATTLADSTKAWPVNYWAGKQCRITGGTVPVIEVTIASNTATVLTYATTTTVSDALTTYTIIGAAPRGSGINCMWNFNQSDATKKGKHLYIPRGGSSVTVGYNAVDRYDINADRWDFSVPFFPAGETETLGSQWIYDGDDNIYWSSTGAQGSRILRIDLNTYDVVPAGQNPYAHGAAVAGSKINIIETADGLKFLYLMRQAGAEMWRTLLWWPPLGY